MEVFKAIGKREQTKRGYGGIKIGDCTTVYDKKEELKDFSHEEIIKVLEGKPPMAEIVISAPYQEERNLFKGKIGATLIEDEKEVDIIFINTAMGDKSMNREEAWDLLINRKITTIDSIVSIVEFSGILNGVATLHHGEVKSVVIYGGRSIGKYDLGERLNQYIQIKGKYILDDTINTRSGRGDFKIKLVDGNIIEECI